MLDRQHREGSHSRVRSIVILSMVIVGVLFLLYPVLSTLWNNHQARQAVEQYREITQDQPEAVVNEELEWARAYNTEYAKGPILDPWLNEFAVNTTDYRRYERQLNSTEAMGRLIIPDIDVDLPIYHGTSSEVLNKGLGHMFGSDLPVGGTGTHAMITGHTGLPHATMFDHLKDLRRGDSFYLQVAGEKLKYDVDQINVVLPNEVETLRAVDGDYVTLITCTPYGVNTHRLLVRGHAVPLDADDAQVFDELHSAGWTWWMTLLVTLAFLALAAVTWWLRWLQQCTSVSTDTVEMV